MAGRTLAAWCAPPQNGEPAQAAVTAGDRSRVGRKKLFKWLVTNKGRYRIAAAPGCTNLAC